MSVYFTNVSNTKDYKYLGMINSPLGTSWKRYEYTIGSFPSNYQLEFLADPYDASKAEIAIDDVEMIRCSPDIKPLDLSLDCDFEENFCQYFKDATGDFEWDRSDLYGPGFDHTTGKGFYAYADSYYPRIRGEKARIYSSIQTKKGFTNSPMCFTFYYHMFGRDIDRLNFYIETFDGSMNLLNRELVWVKEGTQGNRWLRQNVNIRLSNNWRVVFEAVIGKSYNGDISLDDLMLVEGDCPKTHTCDFEVNKKLTNFFVK